MTSTSAGLQEVPPSPLTSAPKPEELVARVAEILRIGRDKPLTTGLAAALAVRLSWILGEKALVESEALGQLSNPLNADKIFNEKEIMERARNIAAVALMNLTIGREEEPR